MPDATNGNYRKLAGTYSGILHRGGLWLAPDHVLVVRNRWIVEEYRRFYLNEIQAIVLRKDPRLTISAGAAVLLACTALATLFLYFARMRWPLEYELSLLGLWALIAFIAYTSIHRSSICHIQTATGSEEVAGLRRYGSARKSVEQLTQEIRTVQGELPERWADELNAAEARYVAVPPTLPQAYAVVAAPSPRWATLAAWGLIIALLFAALLNAFVLLGHRFPSWEVTALILVELAFAAAALVGLRLNARVWPVRSVLVIALIYSGLKLYAYQLIGGVLSIFLAASRQNSLQTRVAYNSAQHGLVVFIFWADLILGLVGAVLLLARGRNRAPAYM